jgi:hypothetical protein
MEGGAELSFNAMTKRAMWCQKSMQIEEEG